MKTILDLLDEIKKGNPNEYTILYSKGTKIKELKFESIQRVQSIYLILGTEGEDINLPVHRIKEIKKSEIIVWRRP